MRCRFACLLPVVAVLLSLLPAGPAAGQQDAATESPTLLTILVADPLAKELACDCVAGFAQRRYEALAMMLEKRLGRRVNSLCGAQLSTYWGNDQRVSLIVGKHSDVIYQARELGRKVHPLAALTDRQGLTTFRGLFVVRSGNPARSIRDLQGYRVILGPASCDEKHGAAIEALRKAGMNLPKVDALETVPSCTDGANELMKLTDQDNAVAVISDYAKVLLEGCQAIPKDALRVVGQTQPLPFVTVFATDEVPPALRATIRQELIAARQFPALLRLLETKDGFRAIADDDPPGVSRDWTDYRGPQRAALVALPESLDGMRTVWTTPMNSRGLGGMAVTGRWIVATDRVEDARTDYVKLLDARTGELRFTGELVEPTGFLRTKNLDYGNSIRATPVVRDGAVYLLDAFGALYHWQLPDSDVFPPTDCITGTSTALLVDGFELITWGLSSTPLLTESADGQTRLILNTCSAAHTLLALEPTSLAVQWVGAGKSSGYASCIVGQWGGRRQIVGYDSLSLGGWDPDTGARLWTVRPEIEGDFNVPTPVALDDQRLLVVTESNGMRIYAFDDEGVLKSDPVAVNEDVANDTVTPVVVAGKAYCTSSGALYQLDTRRGLQTCWTMSDTALNDHVSLLADAAGHRLLVVTYHGELLLFDIARDTPKLVSRRRAFDSSEREEIYAHPSLAGDRLYLRGLRSVKCLQF